MRECKSVALPLSRKVSRQEQTAKERQHLFSCIYINLNTRMYKTGIRKKWHLLRNTCSTISTKVSTIRSGQEKSFFLQRPNFHCLHICTWRLPESPCTIIQRISLGFESIIEKLGSIKWRGSILFRGHKFGLGAIIL